MKREKSRSSDVLAGALSSTIVLFLVLSISTLIAGFLCGHYFGRKYEKSSKKIPALPKPSQPVALYEDVDVLPSAVEHQEQNLELKENVAYGPSKSMSVEQ